METPPPYMPPRKKSNTGLIIGLVLGAIALCCIGGVAVVFGGGAWLFGKAKGIAECTISFKYVEKAVLAYAKDHEGRLPNAETWQDDVKSYYAKTSAKLNDQEQNGPVQIHPFPVEGNWSCTSDSIATGVAINTEVAGKKLADIKDDSTVLLFETEASGRNLHEKYKEREFTASPKIFGKPRGWIITTVAGDISTVKNGRRVDMGGGFDVETKDSESKG